MFNNLLKKNKKYEKKIIIAVIGAIISYIALKYVFLPVVVFITAVILSMLARAITDKIKMPPGYLKTAVSAAVLVLFYSLSLFGIIALFRTAGIQLYNLCVEIGRDGTLINKYISYILGFPKLISGFIGEGDELLSAVSGALSSFISGIVSSLPSLISRIASSVPTVIITLTATVMISLYLCTDKNVPAYMKSKRWLGAAGNLIGSSLCLTLFIFALLFFGMSLAGIKYSFLASLITAFVDMLPVFGVGTVLVPWAALKYISGQTAQGTALLVLFGAATVVRRIAEPKIIGEGIGLSPVLSLLSMLSGYTLLGVRGMLFAPVAAAVIVAALKAVENAENQ